MIKDFKIGAVLSVTTGRFVADDFGEVHELMDFLTGDALFTHTLIRAADPCKAEALRQLPELVGEDVPEMIIEISNQDLKSFALRGWLETMKEKHGATMPLEPMEPGAWLRRDPIDELVDMVGPEKVIVVAMGDGDDDARGDDGSR